MKTRLLAVLGVSALLLFWAGDKISYQIRRELADGANLSEASDRFWYDFRDPLHLSLERPDLISGAVLVAVFALIVAYQLSNRRKFRHGVEHGSARWGTARDIRPFIDRDPANNLLFTRSERLSLDSRKTQRNLHVLVIGSSGSGKTRYYVQPNIAQQNQSFVVTDPNGEILAATGEQLTASGYRVRCLNLVEWSRSDTFNPLAYFTPGQAEVDCLILVQNIISNTTGQKPEGQDSFWEKAERALLTAIVAYVFGLHGTQGTMNHVTEVLAGLQTSENDESFTSAADTLFLDMRETITRAEAFEDRLDEEAARMLSMWRFAWSQYNIYTQGAGETKKSVIISLGVRLAPLYMPSLSRILDSDTIRADLVGQERTALFLVIPDSHETFSFLVAVFYDMFFQKNIALADAAPARTLPVPVHCFMDEFANIGKLPSFHTKIAVMRKRGIATSVILQNFSQGKSLYKDDWETIVGNCDSKLFLGGDEESTTQWISKRLGKETIDSRDDSVQRGGANGSASKSFRKLGRELLTPDEVARLEGSECLYLLRGLPAFRSRKLEAIRSGDYRYTPAPVPEAGPGTQGDPGESAPPAEPDFGSDAFGEDEPIFDVDDLVREVLAFEQPRPLESAGQEPSGG